MCTPSVVCGGVCVCVCIGVCMWGVHAVCVLCVGECACRGSVCVWRVCIVEGALCVLCVAWVHAVCVCVWRGCTP